MFLNITNEQAHQATDPSLQFLTHRPQALRLSGFAKHLRCGSDRIIQSVLFCLKFSLIFRILWSLFRFRNFQHRVQTSEAEKSTRMEEISTSVLICLHPLLLSFQLLTPFTSILPHLSYLLIYLFFFLLQITLQSAEAAPFYDGCAFNQQDHDRRRPVMTAEPRRVDVD